MKAAPQHLLSPHIGVVRKTGTLRTSRPFPWLFVISWLLAEISGGLLGWSFMGILS